jgi:tRNA nucleotidyltransferase (CCA-adding enzyme)
MADYIYMMESRLTPEQQRGVNMVQEVAREHGMNIYLVGGVVRDIISGALIRDLDFAVQGNALKLQKDLEKAGAVVQGADENLRTLYLLMPGNLRGEIASTRQEVYDKPGKPPEITPATINEDLRRRDFTVNAMALSLNAATSPSMRWRFRSIPARVVCSSILLTASPISKPSTSASCITIHSSKSLPV